MFSLSKIIQSKAITLDNNCKSIQGKMGCRLITVILKPPALLLDITTNIFAGIAKIVVRFFIIAPINFSVKLIGKKGVQSEWTIKQGYYHLGVAGLYTLDFFIQPINNIFLGPNIYFKTVATKFCDAFVDSNCKDHNGHTPLYYAIDKGNIAAVEKHIRNGANVNERDPLANTPLLFASYQNKFEIVKKLIDAGADVNAKNQDETTSLEANLEHENPQIIEKLIDSGANINEIKNDGSNLLWKTIYHSKFKMIKILLDRNVRTDAPHNINAPHLFKYAYKKERVVVDQSVKQALIMTPHEKQIKLLKLIGHIAEIPGNGILDGKEIEFSHLINGRLIPKQLQKNLKAFGVAQSLTNNIMEILTDTLELNTGICRPSMEDLMTRYSSNKPIIINTGCRGHAMQVVLWENHFFLCNREKLPPDTQRWQTFKINVSQNIGRMISELKSWESSSPHQVIQSLQNLLSTQAIVHLSSCAELADAYKLGSTHLFEAFSLDQQTTGNCLYSSYEDALYVIWQIAHLCEINGHSSVQECLNHANLSNAQRIIDSLQKVYKDFNSFRTFQMRSYVNRLNAINPLLLSQSQRQHIDQAIAKAQNIA